MDRIQPAARINLWRLRQGFQYVNVFDRAAQWSDADLEAVKRAARDAVARGGYEGFNLTPERVAASVAE